MSAERKPLPPGVEPLFVHGRLSASAYCMYFTPDPVPQPLFVHGHLSTSVYCLCGEIVTQDRRPGAPRMAMACHGCGRQLEPLVIGGES